MATKKFTLYVHKNLESHYMPGHLWVAEADLSESDSFRGECVLACVHEVEVDVPDIDTRSAAIDAINQQIKKERADSEVRVNLLLERISKLQAIGHDGDRNHG